MGLSGSIRIAIIASGAAALLWAGGAAAQTAYAVGQGSPNSITVPIQVTASVGGACGFDIAPDGDYFFANLDLGFTQDTVFAINCNGASRVAVTSANGGLLAGGTAPNGFSLIAPYTVELSLVGDDSVTAAASCAAADLALSAASPCSFRGTASEIVGLELGGPADGTSQSYVRISAPAYSGPEALVAASGYEDTLTVTLAASL